MATDFTATCRGADCTARTDTMHWHGNPDLQALLHPLDDLTLHPKNARKRPQDIDDIAQSLAADGQYQTITARGNVKAHHILVGNHRTKAMQQLAWTHGAVTWKDCTYAQGLKLLAWDNRATDDSTYDTEGLIDLLSTLADSSHLVGSGWTQDDLDGLLRQTRAYQEGVMDPTQEWEGMGEWVSESRDGIRVIVHVAGETQLDDLLELLGQPRGGRSARARSFWWPEKADDLRSEDHSRRYIED